MVDRPMTEREHLGFDLSVLMDCLAAIDDPAECAWAAGQLTAMVTELLLPERQHTLDGVIAD